MKQIPNNENERDETGDSGPGLNKTPPAMGPMTVEHEQWADFIEALLDEEGIDFLVRRDAKVSATWTCDCTDAFPVSRRILAEMGLAPNDVEQSISYFRRNGGLCDCEVFFNVDQLAADDEDDAESAQAEPIGPRTDSDGR
jgi:hypothetical protein